VSGAVCRRIGITGGIAAGKSEVQRILSARGFPVLDTDAVAHEVLKPGQPVYAAVRDYFGPDILRPDGEIDRKRLGAIVFADEGRRRELNALVHPEVGRRWREWVRHQTALCAFVAIPLLFECELENEFDGVLCVWAPEEIMKTRLCLRGLDEQAAQLRIQSQWPVALKRERATWSIRNDGSLDDLEQKIDLWLMSLP
jgi:dephospho-CoA kinase